MERDVDFIVAEYGPNVRSFMLHVLAAIAEEERLVISERTKAALKAALARGVTRKGKPLVKLGNPEQARRNREQALARAETLREVVEPLVAAGHPLRAIARALNDRGVASARGGAWAAPQVMRLLARLQLG